MSAIEGDPPCATSRIVASTIALRVRLRCAVRPEALSLGAALDLLLTFRAILCDYTPVHLLHTCANKENENEPETIYGNIFVSRIGGITHGNVCDGTCDPGKNTLGGDDHSAGGCSCLQHAEKRRGSPDD